MRPCAGDHVEGATCWRCSNLRGWWAEARAAAGVELWVEPPDFDWYPRNGHAPAVTATAQDLAAAAPVRPLKEYRVKAGRAAGGSWSKKPKAERVLRDKDIEAYWERHPTLTYEQAARALRRQV